LAVAGIVLSSAGFAGYKVYERQSLSPQEILLVQNIEALTQQENNSANVVKMVTKVGITQPTCQHKGSYISKVVGAKTRKVMILLTKVANEINQYHRQFRAS
jgi:hypothetical protein